MDSYTKLINDIESFGYTAYFINNTIEVKIDRLDEECYAILWINDEAMIMADMGDRSIPLCELTAWDRLTVLSNFLKDPWNYEDNIHTSDLPQ